MKQALCLGLCIFLLAEAQPRDRFSIDGMQRIVDVSAPVIAADGSKIAFVASRVDQDHNRYTDTLEIYDRRTQSLRPAALGHSSVGPIAWSPDGSLLGAVMNDAKSDQDQLYAIEAASGAELQLTYGRTSVQNFAWSPSGTLIAYSRREYVGPKEGAAAYRDAFEVDDNDYLATKRVQPTHLWLTDRAGKNERRLTFGAWSVGDAPLSWSPDGSNILFLRTPSGVHGVQDRALAMRLDLASGRTAPATAHAIYEDQPLYSPDGSRVAYLYARDGDPMNENDAMVASGALEFNATRALDRHVETIAWMSSGALLVKVYDATTGPLYVQPLAGHARRLPIGAALDASIDPQQSVARDGTVVFSGTQARQPAEIYVLSAGATVPQRVTSFNDGIAALQLGMQRRIAWTGPNGFAEDGVLTYPPGYTAAKKYPLVLRIHGGPTESSLTAFDTFYQLAAARGYLVFAPNYRGSNDLGNTYEHAIYSDASIGPGEDIMAGIGAVERLGIVDTDRLGVSGWSYGGQLTSWMEGHYHIWKAAVAGAAVNDLVVDYAIADDVDANRVFMRGGSPYKGNTLALWRLHSPITYFKSIRTPTLILCNVYDVRVPIVESYEMYHALADNGVPVRFYAYPSTGHLPNGPVRLADAYEKWLAWFDRYLSP